MRIQERYNLQHGSPENKRFSAADYTSDRSIIDQYILARVQTRNNIEERIILDPSAYDSLVDKAAEDIAKQLEHILTDIMIV